MDISIIVPLLNERESLPELVSRIDAVMKEGGFSYEVIMVDDGSDDMDLPGFCREQGVECVRHPENRGKGEAIRTAMALLAPRGLDYMIVLDADGQHYPEDIPLFLPLMEEEGALIVGCRDFNDPNVPGSSRFGRAFSNFWMKLETR